MSLTVLKSFKDLIGKKVVYVYETSYGKNVFLTEDYCILIFEPQEDEIIYLGKAHLGRFFSVHHYILEDMIKKKVITEDIVKNELKSWEEYQARINKEFEDRERKEYERLKAKFEN